MLTFTCESCGTFMQATDIETLDWGIETHSCAASGPRGAQEQQVIDWLVASYGRGFWWFRRDAPPLVVA